MRAGFSGTKTFYFPLLLLTILLVHTSLRTQAAETLSADTHSEFLKGTVSQNELIDNLEKLGIKCIIQEGTAYSLRADKVALGSSAFYAGIRAGDIIKDLHKLSADTFSLSIERSGKIYQINLTAGSGHLAEEGLKGGIKNDLLQGKLNHQDLSAETAVQKTAMTIGIQKSIIPGSIIQQENEPIKKLLPYDIELVIDITGSMNWIDGTDPLTKFQWCHEQVRTLAKLLAPYNKTFTVTVFNTNFTTIPKCTPETVEQIYATIEPNGNTDLVDPLMNRLNSAWTKHQSDKHPVVIVVITDGLPNVPRNPKVVNRALIDFTQQMHDPDDVVVTVLQIGDAFDGRDFCIDLDDNLVGEGAAFDIVDTKTFAELKKEGLVNAMIDAIIEAHNNRHLSKQERHLKRFVNSLPPPSQKVHDTEATIKARQSERQAIEQLILGK